MLRNRLGGALAALHPSSQELVRVGPVGGRTRWAARLSPGAARLEQYPVRLPLGVIHGADLAGLPVGVLDPAGQANGVVAVAGLGDQLHPAVIAGPGPVHDLAEDAREQLAHAKRLGHAALPGVWPATQLGMVAVKDLQRGEQVTGRCLSGSPTGRGAPCSCPRRRLGASTTTTSAPSTCCWAWSARARVWPPRRWSRWASRWRRCGPRSRRASARASRPRPGTSPSSPEPRRSLSCRCARPPSWATTTSGPSTCCSG